VAIALPPSQSLRKKAIVLSLNQSLRGTKRSEVTKQSPLPYRHCERSEAIAFMVLVLFVLSFGVVLKGILLPLRIGVSSSILHPKPLKARLPQSQETKALLCKDTIPHPVIASHRRERGNRLNGFSSFCFVFLSFWGVVSKGSSHPFEYRVEIATAVKDKGTASQRQNRGYVKEICRGKLSLTVDYNP